MASHSKVTVSLFLLGDKWYLETGISPTDKGRHTLIRHSGHRTGRQLVSDTMSYGSVLYPLGIDLMEQQPQPQFKNGIDA